MVSWIEVQYMTNELKDARFTEMVNIAFRGTPEFREMLQQSALKRKMKVQELLVRAVTAYVGGVAKHDVEPVYNPKHVEMHSMLEEILQRGTKYEVDLLVGMLKMHLTALRSRPPVNKKAG